jgi:hypothetical protein
VAIVHDVGYPLGPAALRSLLTIIQGLRPLRHLGAGRAVSECVARHTDAVQAQVAGTEDAQAEHRVLVQGSLEGSNCLVSRPLSDQAAFNAAQTPAYAKYDWIQGQVH